jgi:hypothetical protein
MVTYYITIFKYSLFINQVTGQLAHCVAFLLQIRKIFGCNVSPQTVIFNDVLEIPQHI